MFRCAVPYFFDIQWIHTLRRIKIHNRHRALSAALPVPQNRNQWNQQRNHDRGPRRRSVRMKHKISLRELTADRNSLVGIQCRIIGTADHKPVDRRGQLIRIISCISGSSDRIADFSGIKRRRHRDLPGNRFDRTCPSRTDNIVVQLIGILQRVRTRGAVRIAHHIGVLSRVGLIGRTDIICAVLFADVGIRVRTCHLKIRNARNHIAVRSILIISVMIFRNLPHRAVMRLYKIVDTSLCDVKNVVLPHRNIHKQRFDIIVRLLRDDIFRRIGRRPGRLRGMIR